MANHNCKTKIYSSSTFIVDLSQTTPSTLLSWKEGYPVFAGSCLVGPLRMCQSTLGFGTEEPCVEILDSAGTRVVARSVQTLLHLIDYFEARDRSSLLSAAALHYDLDGLALMGADLQSMWNVCDDSGKILLAGVTHQAACAAADVYMQRPDWSGDIKIRRQNADDGMFDPRHEGPLVLLHHNLGATSFEGVAVRSHVGRCGMMLQEVLRRFDQFGPADQTELLAGLAKHFDLSPVRGNTTCGQQYAAA